MKLKWLLILQWKNPSDLVVFELLLFTQRFPREQS